MATVTRRLALLLAPLLVAAACLVGSGCGGGSDGLILIAPPISSQPPAQPPAQTPRRIYVAHEGGQLAVLDAATLAPIAGSPFAGLVPDARKAVFDLARGACTSLSMLRASSRP